MLNSCVKCLWQRETCFHKGPSTYMDTLCCIHLRGKVSPDSTTLKEMTWKNNQLRTTTFYFSFMLVPDMCLLQQMLWISAWDARSVLILDSFTQSPPTDTVRTCRLICCLQQHWRFLPTLVFAFSAAMWNLSLLWVNSIVVNTNPYIFSIFPTVYFAFLC